MYAHKNKSGSLSRIFTNKCGSNQLKSIQDNRHQNILQLEEDTGRGLDGKETKVKWNTATLGGDTVGVKMVALPLGPDHNQGGPPKSGMQNKLMSKLETTPSNSNDKKYIRGHLLNDNLGGEGAAYNLYPLTGNANKEHSNKIEETVKSWVNGNRQWVSYQVEVEENDKKLDSKTPAENFVDATFKCEASVLNPNNLSQKVKTIKANIKSEYKANKTTNPEWTNENALLPTASQDAQDIDVLESTSKSGREYKLTDELFNRIQYLQKFAYIDNAVSLFEYIDSITGIGAGTIDAYKIIIKAIIETQNDLSNINTDLSRSIKYAITKINNHEEDILAAIDHYVAKVEAEEDMDEDFVLQDF